MAARPEAETPNDGNLRPRAFAKKADDYYPTRTLWRRAGSQEIAVIVPCKSRKSWIVDSGAANHFVNDLSYFKAYHVENGPFMECSNGQTSPIVGAGTVELHLLREDGQVAVHTLTHAYFAPESTCNMLSLLQLELETGVQIRHDRAITLRCADGVDMGHVVRHERLCYLVPSPAYHDTDNRILYSCPDKKALLCVRATQDIAKVKPCAKDRSDEFHVQCPIIDRHDHRTLIPCEDLPAHVQTHRHESYECVRVFDLGCTERFSSETAIKEHMAKAHMWTRVGPVRTYAVIDLRTPASARELTDGQTLHTCLLCLRLFLHRRELIMHHIRSHGDGMKADWVT